MFLRALRICDPQYLEQEFNHIHRSFLRLGYPSYFVKQCLSKANRKYYQANNVNTHSTDNFITIPFSPQLITAQQLLSNVNRYHHNNNKVNLAFRYSNTLRTRLVRNKNSSHDKEVGVYCIPCLDCGQCYIGESGRGLDVRLEEHKRACRLGRDYSAVATHSIGLDHRIGFRQAKIIYNSNNRNTRKIIEGALISLNNTFVNNKSSTQEGEYVNAAICKAKRFL